ncbi:uncharacterized protein TCAP_04518, partial [Tolypocladium capitatum]
PPPALLECRAGLLWPNTSTHKYDLLFHRPLNHAKLSSMLVPQSTLYQRPVYHGSRKRRRPSCSDPSPHADAAHHSSKKQRLSHPDFPPTRFWENLSKQHLTKNALRAIDGVEGARPLNSSLRRSQRLAARRPSESTSNQQPVQAFLRYSSPTSLGEIKRFASHGGLDLRDLRGCRFTRSKYKMSSRESSLGRRKRGSQSPVKSSRIPNTTITKSTGPYDPSPEATSIITLALLILRGYVRPLLGGRCPRFQGGISHGNSNADY